MSMLVRGVVSMPMLDTNRTTLAVNRMLVLGTVGRFAPVTVGTLDAMIALHAGHIVRTVGTICMLMEHLGHAVNEAP